MIVELTKNDFKAKYLGSYLGIFWAFIHPTITILVLWLVFQFGFKSMPVNDYPFVNWLISGIIPWFFFTESLGNGTSSIVDNSFLVKKVAFRVSLLPIIKILSALAIHVFFIFVVIIINWFYGFEPTIYTLQIFYYLFALILLLLGLTWLTSAIYVFFKDTAQVISIIISLGFWVTPVYWTFSIVPDKYKLFFKFNPMIYIVEGYRSAYLYHTWFWDDMPSFILFWCETCLVLVMGVFVFRKLRSQFSDVI
jgi:ABC-type polysaccharide/polyol phosphate export permease